MTDRPPPASHVYPRESWRPGPRRKGRLGPLAWNLGSYQGYPCWKLRVGKLIRVDLDWNTDRFGGCLGVRIGTRHDPDFGRYDSGWCALTLDWMAPLGEPNRLYLFGPKWEWMLGLPDNRSLEETGEYHDGIAVVREVTGRWGLTRGQAWTRRKGWRNELPYRVLVRSPRDRAKQDPLGPPDS
jgi:hypothetical protein